MRVLLAVSLIVLGACDRGQIGPRLTVDLRLQRSGPRDMLVRAHVKNEGDRATVPLNVTVTAGDGTLLLHPVPFVLNHGEVRDLQTSVLGPVSLKATLKVSEAERGLTVATRTATLE